MTATNKKCRIGSSGLMLCGLLGSVSFIYANEVYADEGQILYQQHCATCHDSPESYTPPKATLALRSPETILDTLNNGVMQAQAAPLSEDERQQVAVYISGKQLGESGNNPLDHWKINSCGKAPTTVTEKDFHWNGWGNTIEAHRYQPNPGFDATDVPKLKVKWAFAYPGGRANSQPVLIGDQVLVASRPGLLYSLDANTGCTYWVTEIGGGARAAIFVAAITSKPFPQIKYAAYVASSDRAITALDLKTGKTLWKTTVENHSRAVMTGAPIVVDDTLIVPISSLEEPAARDENYECCTFRGALVALDKNSGEILWKTHVIDEAPKPFRKNERGTQMYGPAGGAIWSAPSYDKKRHLIYAATGDSYTDVVEKGSDAIVAFDFSTGAIKWRHQVTEQDNYVLGCVGDDDHANCPDTMGPDYDFGSTPIVHHYKNKRNEDKTLVLTGQKSGIIYAMDPDQDGKIIWQQQAGVGSVRGGIQWGSAADDANVYVAVSDSIAPPDNRKPGLSAFDLITGELKWHTPAPKGECSDRAGRMTCTNGQSSAVTAMPGAVFSGALNGFFRGYDSDSGKIIWEVDTNKVEVESVNGIRVRGGNMDQTGPTIANGKLFVNAGYGSTPDQPGNVLFVYSVDGK